MHTEKGQKMKGFYFIEQEYFGVGNIFPSEEISTVLKNTHLLNLQDGDYLNLELNHCFISVIMRLGGSHRPCPVTKQDTSTRSPGSTFVTRSFTKTELLHEQND
jgi:hypothetical protein